MNGLHIVVEGPDACGKSTAVKTLVEWIQKEQGQVVNAYANPGSTPLGKEIRQIVKNRHDLVYDKYTEQVIFMADVCNYLNDIVKPQVARGEVVISDRSNLISGMAYGLAGSLTYLQIDALHNVVLAVNPPPMHVILLTGEYETLVERKKKRMAANGENCKFESRSPEYHKCVIETYNKIAKLATAGHNPLFTPVVDELDNEIHKRLIKIIPSFRRTSGVWWYSIHVIDTTHLSEDQMREKVIEEVRKLYTVDQTFVFSGSPSFSVALRQHAEPL